ncbi:MAG TPA: dienelactone hydrolase family protein [Nevskiaceae bacterium]|nr:dienelactone hydrolase family protein [Nevskiaceae bacterium]
MTTRWIDMAAPGGGMFKGYVSLPPTGRGPGLLLIQEIFGVNEHIRAVADQYALDGYTVLAPDVFWRLEPGVQLGYDQAGFEKGIQLMQAADFKQAVGDLAVALKNLRSLGECTGKAAVMGYCMGGLLSYLTAANTDVDAAVCYYGGGIQGQLAQAPQVKCPILFHYAAKDGFIPPEAVAAVQQAFEAKPNARVHVYDGVDHGFNCWARGSYDQKASALARGRTLEFLSRTIS